MLLTITVLRSTRSSPTCNQTTSKGLVLRLYLRYARGSRCVQGLSLSFTPEDPRLHGSIPNLRGNRKPDCGDLDEETSTDRVHAASVDPREERNRETVARRERD